MNQQDHNFVNCNLQNRSFQGLELQGADFRGADIRGCNFSYAQLQNANFLGAKIGRSPKLTIILIVVTVFVAIASFIAITQMSFGVVEKTPEDVTWSFKIALFVSLAVAGLSSAIASFLQNSSIWQRLMKIISGAASAALLGFYYGGSSTSNNTQLAIASAAIAAIISAAICLIFGSPSQGFLGKIMGNTLTNIAIAMAGSINNYGLAFLISSLSVIYLSSRNFLLGIFYTILTLIMVGMSLLCFTQVIKEINSVGMTSFQHANLLDAKFD